MSLRYIIDGYNIIHHPIFISQRPTKKNQEPRLELLEFIRIKKPCGSPKNQIIVVFDGHSDSSWQNLDKTDIHVIFSRGQSADERIKKMVEQETNPKNTVVVSDDKEIRFFIKSIGARPMNIEEFIKPKKEINKVEQDLLKPELNFSQVHKINQELKKIWLKNP